MKNLVVKRHIIGWIAAICALFVLGIVGGIEHGESPLIALYAIPALAILIFNCYILGLFD